MDGLPVDSLKSHLHGEGVLALPPDSFQSLSESNHAPVPISGRSEAVVVLCWRLSANVPRYGDYVRFSLLHCSTTVDAQQGEAGSGIWVNDIRIGADSSAPIIPPK